MTSHTACKEEGVEPHVNAAPMRRFSLLPSLLVERHDLEKPGEQTHLHNDQVVTPL